MMNRGKISITQLILRQKAKLLIIAKLQATIMQLLVVKTKTSCVRKGVSWQRIPKAWICVQNKLPSAEEFFIAEDDVWIVAKSQTSSEKILFPDTCDPVIVVPVTVENRSTSFNFGKLKYSHIKRCTKVKRKGRTSTYPSRTPDSVCVPRFNSRIVHFSIRYRGVALWNKTLANDHSIVSASCKTLSTKLKDNASFLNFNFYATSISTADFSDHDYVYF